jgi:excisionase family DNA binding protein
MNPGRARKGAGRPRGKRNANVPSAELSDVMTVKQVAEYLNCPRSTVYWLLEQRKVPGLRLGGRWRFLRSELEQWIRDRQSKPEAPSERKRKSRSQ